MNLYKLITISLLTIGFAHAAKFRIVDEVGQPVHLAMVTEKIEQTFPPLIENGYPKSGVSWTFQPEVTKFTNKQGVVSFPDRSGKRTYRIRKYRFQDHVITADSIPTKIIIRRENDVFKIAEQKPANVWLGALTVGSEEDKIIFKMQCGYCHQQGAEYTRQERDPKDWHQTIKRMVRYGSRLSSDLQESLPQVLQQNYKKLRENPGLLAEPREWGDYLENATIREWPIGDDMSQTHDMLVAQSGLVYVADNIQDRIYEIDTKLNQITIYKVPHREGETNGGLIAGRLKDFPRHDSTSNAHSLTESKVDGHIFITPSAQRRLVEFNPHKKTFELYDMEDGFYPHTIRMDSKDNVWFTLALSNQVAMFNRKTKKFKYYDLPARNLKEKILTKNIYYIFKIINAGVPLSNWLPIDRISSGVPLVYGIDITPDDRVWVARLHTKEIGVIDPVKDTVQMISTPFWGPRRLRADRKGNLWIGSFGESKISKFDPKSNQFKMFDLPVNPVGSDTPYSLNVDHDRNLVWVTGNQSDSLHSFDMTTESWKSYPLPRRTTFTRDMEFGRNGEVYTSNSNFPSWHIEDSQPTLIEIMTK